MKRPVILLIAIFLTSYLWSQSLPIAKEFRQAVKNQTRTLTGKPGPKYFTNHSDYTIHASFDPATAQITGDEKIVYYNNSPDTLKMLVLRLYQNLLKKGNIRSYPVDPRDLTDGENLTLVKIGNDSYSQKQVRTYATLAFIRLKTPIMPHSKTQIHIKWQCQIPQYRAIRYGKYGPKTFFVGYWYPQIAVYDDVFGWNKTPFIGTQEFYNDHNNYDVYLTVPAPNIVWGTGLLANYKEIFKTSIVKRIEKAKKSDNVVHIISKSDLKHNLLKKSGLITWHFQAHKVPDFAFATSDHYLWDGTSLKLPNNKRVFISAVYNPKSKNFYRKAHLVRQILYNYTYVLPKITFPYPSMTVFNGGGAMEYPTMVNMANFPKNCEDIYVTAHEVGHSYFPFMTGTNETVFAWMDEGIINYFPRYVQHLIDSSCNSFKQMVHAYTYLAGSYYDLPNIVPSDVVWQWQTYRHIAYYKPSFALYQLTQYLGDSLFFKALRTFAYTWKYKHPQPYDFFFTFNTVSKQNLNWFWKAYYFQYNYPDMAITSASYQNNQLTATITNKGGLPMKIVLTVVFPNKTSKTFTAPMSVWKNSATYTFKINLKQKPVKLILGDQYTPDINPQDNIYKF